jgi:XRE family transcriptional regulator, regulator of sulfur utilization
MDQLDRRDLFAALSAFAALGAATGAAGAAAGDKLLDSKVIRYADLPVRTFPNGGTQRRVISGTLATGEFIEVHETMLPAGEMPHPPHKHPNTEMLFIQTGSLEYLDDGKPLPCGPGDIVFTASERLHGLKNVGKTPATYIVVSVGKQLPEG